MSLSREGERERGREGTVQWICMTFDIVEFHKNFQQIAVSVKLKTTMSDTLHEDVYEIVCTAPSVFIRVDWIDKLYMVAVPNTFSPIMRYRF